MDLLSRLGSPSERARAWLGVAGLGLLYFVVASASISLLGSQGVGGFSGPVLWPASGVYLGVLLLSERRLWPALACGALAGSFAAHLLAGSSAAVSVGFAVPNSAGSLFAAVLLRRRDDDRRVLERPQDVAVFVLLGAVVVNALTALSAAAAAKYGLGAPLGDGWVRWWSADGLGIVAVAPIFAATSWPRRGPSSRAELLHLAALIAGVAGAGYVIAAIHPWDRATVLGGALALPVLLSAGWRWGPRVAALGGLCLALVAAYTGAHDGQLFSSGGAASVHVLVVQTSLAVVVIAPLAFALAVAAHSRTESALREATRRLRRIVGAAPDAYVSVDGGGRIVEWSRRAEETFGWTSAEVVDKRLDETIVPEAAQPVWVTELARPADGRGEAVGAVQLLARHRSGRELQIELTRTGHSADAAAGADLFIRDVSEREQIRAELERVNGSLTAKSEELTRSVHEREAVRTELTRAKQRVAEREAELAEARGTVAALELERDRIERELGAELADRDRALGEAGVERERLQAELERVERELGGARERAAEAERGLDWARERQAETDAELEDEREHVADVERELGLAREHGARADAELERVRERQEQTGVELQQARGRAADLERTLEWARQRGARTDGELERAQERAANVGRELELAQARGAETDGELQRARERVSNLEQELVFARARGARADAELERARERAAELEREASEQKAWADAELGRTRERVADAQRELARAREQQTRTDAELSALMTRYESTAAELASLRVQHERAQIALGRAQRAHEQQEQRWAADQRRLESALVATAMSLADAQRERRLLEDHSHELIARYDHRGICLYTSPAWNELLGYEPDELIGRQGAEILHPEDRTRVREARASASETRFNARLRHKSGEFRQVEALFRPLRDERGQLIEIEAVLREIPDEPAVGEQGDVPRMHDLTERIRSQHRLAG